MANIQTYLNNIKNALFGKDVRASIHDGIDAINKEVESTTGRQVDLENTFDQLVINAGNSNAEIVDARVKNDGTSYSKLGDRLDAVDSQLAHIAHLIKPTGEDDTETIQNSLNEYNNIIFENGATFKVSYPIKITKDNMNINFNNALFEFTYDKTKEIINTDKINALFMFEGEILKEGIKITSHNLSIGELTLENLYDLNIGSYLQINIDSEYNEEIITPKVKRLVKVLNIYENTVTVDFSSPFSDYITINSDSHVNIVKPLENIKVENGKFIDKTDLGNIIPDTSNQYEETGHLVNFITFNNVVNSNISNIFTQNTTLHAVYIRYCDSIKVDNIANDNVRLFAGGEGYCIKVVRSKNIELNNIKGKKVRHLSDFSCSSNCVISNSYCNEAKESAYHMHGAYEHDIIYKNCSVVNTTFGYSTTSGESYGNCNINICYENCNGRFYSNNVYTRNFNFKNCDLTYLGQVADATFDNCKIIINLLYFSDWNDFESRIDFSTRQQFLNSSIKFDSNNILYIRKFNKLIFNNCYISPNSSASNLVRLCNIEDFKLLNSNSHVRFEIRNDVISQASMKISNNIFKSQNASYTLSMNSTTNCVLYCDISNNTLNGVFTSGSIVFRASNTDDENSNNTLYGSINNNYCYGRILVHNVEVETGKIICCFNQATGYQNNNGVEFLNNITISKTTTE